MFNKRVYLIRRHVFLGIQQHKSLFHLFVLSVMMHFLFHRKKRSLMRMRKT